MPKTKEKPTTAKDKPPTAKDNHTHFPIVKKYNRTKFMPLEISILQACGTAFGYFPNRVEVSSISTILGKSPRCIQVWFQNVRQRKIHISSQNYLDACEMLSYDLEDPL